MLEHVDTFLLDGDNVSKLMYNSLTKMYLVLDGNGNLEVPPGADLDQVVVALHARYGVDPNEPN